MITVTCTEKLRDKSNRIVGYELKDCNGNKMRFTSEQVKQAVFLQQITIKNLKLTSDGRLIDSKELVQSDSQSKSSENNQLTLINKLKNMKCYQIMKLSVDDIAHIIEKMSNIKLEEIPFINPEQYGIVGKLYFSGCIPFLITKRDTKCLECKRCSRNKTDDYDKIEDCYDRIEDCYVEIPFPSDDEKYSKYQWGDYKIFLAYANDVKTLVQVASIWKNIPNTKISYGDIAYALQELMLKYVDTKYATVNNVLKLHSDVIYDDDEWDKYITTLAFTIHYEENIYIGKTHKQEIDVQVVNVFMSLTKDGYEIQALDYKYKVAYDYRHILDILEDKDNCFSTTIGFNDNLKNAMRKVKLLIDDKFKSSLKDVKDSVKEVKNKYKNGYVY